MAAIISKLTTARRALTTASRGPLAEVWPIMPKRSHFWVLFLSVLTLVEFRLRYLLILYTRIFSWLKKCQGGSFLSFKKRCNFRHKLWLMTNIYYSNLLNVSCGKKYMWVFYPNGSNLDKTYHFVQFLKRFPIKRSIECFLVKVCVHQHFCHQKCIVI